jgi:hypothetical protein
VGQETFTALVSSIAAAVVEAIGTRSWRGVRDQMVDLLGRGDHVAAQLVADQLDDTSARLAQAEPERRAEVSADLVAAWSRLLRGWAAEHPVAAAELLDVRRSLGTGQEIIGRRTERPRRPVVVALRPGT